MYVFPFTLLVSQVHGRYTLSSMHLIFEVLFVETFLTQWSINLCKTFLCNVVDFTILCLSEPTTGSPEDFSKFTRKYTWQSLFFNKVAGWSNWFWSFSYLLLKISHLFDFNRKMILKKKNTLMEFKYLLFCSSIPPFCGPSLIYNIQIPPIKNFHLIYSWLQLDSNPQPLSS